MNVLILLSLPPAEAGEGRLACEFDLSPAASLISAALPGAAVAAVRGELGEVLQSLEQHKPDVVFNLCEAPAGRPELEAHVAALFEWKGQRFTGSGSAALTLCRRKDWTKALLDSAGVPVPQAGGFPCIVKPADQDGSAGIDPDCVCADAAALARVRARIAGPLLVEEFLPGREFAVSLWGAAEPEYVSVGEFHFSNGLRINSYASKWDANSADFANTAISYEEAAPEPALRATVIATARRAWQVLGLRGYARVDLRCDAAGAPRVLDVNPNPALAPGEGLHRAVLAAGWSWQAFVLKQLEWA